ncbi:20629_t:CDS:2, partial [Gigaspora rosea]
MTTVRTPNNDEQPTLLAFSDVTPSITPEENPHNSEPGIESPKIPQETLNEPSLLLENLIRLISEKFPSRTFAEKMEPAFKFSSYFNIIPMTKAIKSAEKVTSTELSITPRVDEALNKTFDFVIRDLVNSFYDPINLNKNTEFSNQVRNAMNVMSMNLALCLQNVDKMEVGIMSSFAIANTFIIHLREYRKFIATNQSLE